MGESGHNNHHAHPGSARIGLDRGQADPDWRLAGTLRRSGLAWNVVLPEHLPPRPAAQRVAAPGEGCRDATRLLARG